MNIPVLYSLRKLNLEGFPSGQRGQTVNLLSTTSMVRIHLPPPHMGCLATTELSSPAVLFQMATVEKELLIAIEPIASAFFYHLKTPGAAAVSKRKLLPLCFICIDFSLSIWYNCGRWRKTAWQWSSLRTRWGLPARSRLRCCSL